jgi:hypothetical protein
MYPHKYSETLILFTVDTSRNLHKVENVNLLRVVGGQKKPKTFQTLTNMFLKNFYIILIFCRIFSLTDMVNQLDN